MHKEAQFSREDNQDGRGKTPQRNRGTRSGIGPQEGTAPRALLGLASEQDYKPANASVAERAAFRIDKQQAQYQRNLENIYAMALSYTPSDVTGVELDPTGYINSSKWPSRSTIARCKIYGLGYSQVKSSIQQFQPAYPSNPETVDLERGTHTGKSAGNGGQGQQ